jgi:hypothetical protein
MFFFRLAFWLTVVLLNLPRVDPPLPPRPKNSAGSTASKPPSHDQSGARLVASSQSRREVAEHLEIIRSRVSGEGRLEIENDYGPRLPKGASRSEAAPAAAIALDAASNSVRPSR